MANASRDEIEHWYRSYPPTYATCREFRHDERPFTVDRPNGLKGIIVVTRKCTRCERRTTRTYTAQFVRIPERTVVAYQRPYLAPKGTGGVDRAAMAERAIGAELAALEAEQAARRATSKADGLRPNGPSRNKPVRPPTGPAGAGSADAAPSDDGARGGTDRPPRPRTRKSAQPARKSTPRPPTTKR